MKKINFSELKTAGIVGGAQADIKKAYTGKSAETKVSAATGAETHDEWNGERETIVTAGGAALKSAEVQQALKAASEKPLMGK